MNCECRECRELPGDDSTSGKRTRSGMTSWNNVQVTQDIPQTSLSTVFIGNLETVRREICVLSQVIWILFLERLAVVKFTVSSTNIITFTSTYWDGRSIFKPQKSWTNECQWENTSRSFRQNAAKLLFKWKRWCAEHRVGLRKHTAYVIWQNLYTCTSLLIRWHTGED